MQQIITKDQRGVGHQGLILAVVIIIALGGAGWWILKKNSDTTSKQPSNCASDDKNLCAFLANQKTSRPYTTTSTTKQNGKETKTVFRLESPTKVHTIISGAATYETIVIDTTLYTKAANGTWWKQTLPKADTDKYKPQQTDFAQPDKTQSYKSLGKAACGTQTCFKYEKVDSSAPKDTKQYLWFDTKSYRLQRTQTITKDSVSDTTFDYAAVKVMAPQNAKDLAPNQYLAPGQSDPITMPHTGDDTDNLSAEELQQLMQQYQANQ